MQLLHPLLFYCKTFTVKHSHLVQDYSHTVQLSHDRNISAIILSKILQWYSTTNSLLNNLFLEQYTILTIVSYLQQRFDGRCNVFPAPGSYNDPRTAFETLKRYKTIFFSPVVASKTRFQKYKWLLFLLGSKALKEPRLAKLQSDFTTTNTVKVYQVLCKKKALYLCENSILNFIKDWITLSILNYSWLSCFPTGPGSYNVPDQVSEIIKKNVYVFVVNLYRVAWFCY
jgi:hypothetical protein